VSARDTVDMIEVDGVRYRPEEAKAFGLEATEPVPVEDVTPPSRKLTEEQQARLEEIFQEAEAIEAERDALVDRVASLEAERDQLKEQIVELEKPAATPAAKESTEDEVAPATKPEAVTTKSAQPANKARTPRGKGA
jgi:peptidoglycan hydrolase CwlO-like protein